MTDKANTAHAGDDTASGGTPEAPDPSSISADGSTKDATDENGAPVDNPAG